MDLRLTSNELEIKHGTKEDIIAVLSEMERLLGFKLNIPFPLNKSAEDLKEEIIEDTNSHSEDDNNPLTIVLGHNTLINVPKKKLVFDKCHSCGDTFGTMVEVNPDIAPIVKCKCGYSQYACDLTKGSYECECGQKGFFLMTPEAQEIKCKSCDNKFYMVKDDNINEFVGYYN